MTNKELRQSDLIFIELIESAPLAPILDSGDKVLIDNLMLELGQLFDEYSKCTPED